METFISTLYFFNQVKQENNSAKSGNESHAFSGWKVKDSNVELLSISCKSKILCLCEPFKFCFVMAVVCVKRGGLISFSNTNNNDNFSDLHSVTRWTGQCQVTVDISIYLQPEFSVLSPDGK